MISITSERIAQEKNLFTLDRWLEHLAQVSIASIEWDVPDTIGPGILRGFSGPVL